MYPLNCRHLGVQPKGVAHLSRAHGCPCRVHALHEDGTTKLDIAMFKRCLESTGVYLDHDEIECVLANLIYKGYLKGYL